MIQNKLVKLMGDIYYDLVNRIILYNFKGVTVKKKVGGSNPSRSTKKLSDL